MRVLIACEFSGTVRDAFRQRGHQAFSCDVIEDGSPYHLCEDVRDVLTDGWDLMIAHPPCTYLCSSGLHWNTRRPERKAETEKALVFVRDLMAAPIERIAIENPVGCIGTRIRPADQTIQPWQFGEDASKRTCLWLKNLPILQPLPEVAWISPRAVWNDAKGRYDYRWANQTDSGQNRLGPSPDRWAKRAQTYPGIAAAMAEQWGRA